MKPYSTNCSIIFFVVLAYASTLFTPKSFECWASGDVFTTVFIVLFNYSSKNKRTQKFEATVTGVERANAAVHAFLCTRQS